MQLDRMTPTIPADDLVDVGPAAPQASIPADDLVDVPAPAAPATPAPAAPKAPPIALDATGHGFSDLSALPVAKASPVTPSGSAWPGYAPGAAPPAPIAQTPALQQAIQDPRSIPTRLWDATKAATPVGGTHGVAGSIAGVSTLGVGIPGTGTGSSPAQGFNALFDKTPPPVESLYSMANPQSEDDMRALAHHLGQRVQYVAPPPGLMDALAPSNPAGETYRDAYGYSLTPEAEAAANLARRGWDNLTPAEKNRFQTLMQTAAVKYQQLQQPLDMTQPVSAGDVPIVGNRHIQNVADAALSTTKTLTGDLGMSPEMSQQYNAQLAQDAKDHPILNAGERFGGAVIDPVARLGARAVGEAVNPVLNEGRAVSLASAIRDRSLSRAVGAAQNSFIHGTAAGAAFAGAGQIARGHIDPDEIVHEAGRQAVQNIAFDAAGAGVKQIPGWENFVRGADNFAQRLGVPRDAVYGRVYQAEYGDGVPRPEYYADRQTDQTMRRELGLDVNGPLTPESIRTAYREVAKTTHPDAPGGNAEQFQKATLAYRFLVNKYSPAPKAASGVPPVPQELPAGQSPKQETPHENPQQNVGQPGETRVQPAGGQGGGGARGQEPQEASAGEAGQVTAMTGATPGLNAERPVALNAEAASTPQAAEGATVSAAPSTAQSGQPGGQQPVTKSPITTTQGQTDGAAGAVQGAKAGMPTPPPSHTEEKPHDAQPQPPVPQQRDVPNPPQAGDVQDGAAGRDALPAVASPVGGVVREAGAAAGDQSGDVAGVTSVGREELETNRQMYLDNIKTKRENGQPVPQQWLDSLAMINDQLAGRVRGEGIASEQVFGHPEVTSDPKYSNLVPIRVSDRASVDRRIQKAQAIIDALQEEFGKTQAIAHGNISASRNERKLAAEKMASANFSDRMDNLRLLREETMPELNRLHKLLPDSDGVKDLHPVPTADGVQDLPTVHTEASLNALKPKELTDLAVKMGVKKGTRSAMTRGILAGAERTRQPSDPTSIRNRLSEAFGITPEGDSQGHKVVQKLTDAIINKDADYVNRWVSVGDKKWNAKTKAAFSEITGVALPGTVKGNREAVDRWAGVTPEERATRDAKSDADRAEKDEVKRQKDIEDAAASRQIKRDTTGKVLNGKEWVDEVVSDGFDRFVSIKQGATPRYYLQNKEGKGYALDGAIKDYARLAIDRLNNKRIEEEAAAVGNDPEIDRLFGKKPAPAPSGEESPADRRAAELREMNYRQLAIRALNERIDTRGKSHSELVDAVLRKEGHLPEKAEASPDPLRQVAYDRMQARGRVPEGETEARGDAGIRANGDVRADGAKIVSGGDVARDDVQGGSVPASDSAGGVPASGDTQSGGGEVPTVGVQNFGPDITKPRYQIKAGSSVVGKLDYVRTPKGDSWTLSIYGPDGKDSNFRYKSFDQAYAAAFKKKPAGSQLLRREPDNPATPQESLTGKTTYLNGDKATYTGKSEVLHGGTFDEVRMLEGPDKGKLKVIPSKEQSDANVAKKQQERKDQQEQFARLHEKPTLTSSLKELSKLRDSLTASDPLRDEIQRAWSFFSKNAKEGDAATLRNIQSTIENLQRKIDKTTGPQKSLPDMTSGERYDEIRQRFADAAKGAQFVSGNEVAVAMNRGLVETPLGYMEKADITPQIQKAIEQYTKDKAEVARLNLADLAREHEAKTGAPNAAPQPEAPDDRPDAVDVPAESQAGEPAAEGTALERNAADSEKLDKYGRPEDREYETLTVYKGDTSKGARPAHELDAADPKDAEQVVEAYQRHMQGDDPAALDTASLDAVNAAYRTLLKPIPAPPSITTDTNLFALPGKEKDLLAVAVKMGKAAKVAPYEPKYAKPKSAKVEGLPSPAEDEADVITSVSKAMAKVATRYAINGVHIADKGKTVIATDGHRLFMAQRPKGSYGKEGTWEVGKGGALAKPLDGTFPPYKDVIGTTDPADRVATLNILKTVRALRQASVMTNGQSKGVHVVLNTDGTLGFASSAPDQGMMEINVQAGHRHLGGVNPEYLLDALEFHHKLGVENAEMWWPRPGKPIALKGGDSRIGLGTSVTMPVNVEDKGLESLRKSLHETPQEEALRKAKDELAHVTEQIKDVERRGPHSRYTYNDPTAREAAKRIDLEGYAEKKAAIEARIAELTKPPASTANVGPGAANLTDPNFRVETGGSAVVPDTAPRVVATTLSPEANDTRSALTLGKIAHGAWDAITRSAGDAGNTIADSLRRYAQISFPALKRNHSPAADSAATLTAVREIVKYQGDALASNVLDSAGHKAGDEFDRKLGAVLVEDQLRGVRAKFEKAGDTDSAANVRTIIGAPDSPFKTEADYRAALSNDEIQAGLAAHRQFVEPVTEENYRLSAKIDPSEAIEARGADTNSHISLKAIHEDADPEYTSTGLKAGGNIRNTLEKHSALERTATGRGNQYELRYSELVKNAIEKGTLPAAQARLYKSLVDGGLAVYGKPGQKPTIDGRPTVAMDTLRKSLVVVKPGHKPITAKQDEKLYIRTDVAAEVRNALKVDQPDVSKVLRPIAAVNTQITLTSGVEGIAHAANHFAVLFKTPTKGSHLPTWIVNVPGVPKVAGVLDAVGTKAYQMFVRTPEIQSQLARLADIGALKPEHENTGFAKYNPMTYLLGKPIEHLAKASRLVLNDSYQMLVDKGLVEDSPAARRDFINQVGQYHKEAQNSLVRVARNIGASDFATAGATFYTQGLRTLTGSMGAKGGSFWKEAAIRLFVFAQLAGTLAQIALINYLRTGFLQPPGTPLGSLYTRKDDKDRPKYIDVADIIGAKRGMRAIGADAAVETLRKGGTPTQAFDKAYTQGKNAAVSPFIGPALKTIGVAATGSAPFSDFDDAGRAAPGESQAKKNLVAAAKELNPTIADFVDSKANHGDFLTSQMGKFGERTGSDTLRDRINAFLNEQGRERTQTFNPTATSKAMSDLYSAAISGDKAATQRRLNEIQAQGKADKVLESIWHKHPLSPIPESLWPNFISSLSAADKSSLDGAVNHYQQAKNDIVALLPQEDGLRDQAHDLALKQRVYGLSPREEDRLEDLRDALRDIAETRKLPAPTR